MYFLIGCIWTFQAFLLGAIYSKPTQNLVIHIFGPNVKLILWFSAFLTEIDCCVFQCHSVSLSLIQYNCVQFIQCQSMSFSDIMCPLVSFSVGKCHSLTYRVFQYHSVSVIQCHSLSFSVIHFHLGSFSVIQCYSVVLIVIHCHSVPLSVIQCNLVSFSVIQCHKGDFIVIQCQ